MSVKGVSSSGSFSSRIKPKSPIARVFMIPKSQCAIAKADDLVKDVIALLVRNDFARRRCYVVDNEGRCIGMLGLGSLVRAWYDGKDVKALKISEVMRSEYSFCSDTATLEACRGIMGKERVHYLVVTKGGKEGGQMLGAMTSWLVAQEQATQGLPYPHNKLAQNYNTLYRKLSPEQLSLHSKL